MNRFTWFVSIATVLAGSLAVHAAEATSLADLKSIAKSRVSTQNGASWEQADGVVFSVDKGQNYPGVTIKPDGEVWDLAGRSAVEVKLTNIGDNRARVHARVDNPGDWRQNPWNVNATTLKPGQTGTIRVTFGESYGNPAFKLDPANIVHVLVFAEKPGGPTKIRIEDIQAVGSAPVASNDPADPAKAAELEGDDIVPLNAAGAEQFQMTSGQVSVDPGDDGLIVTIAPGPEGYPGAKLKPEGAQVWDLSDHGHVSARVTNLCDQSYNISLRVDNPDDWRKNPWNTEGVWIKPGQTRDIKVIFGYQYGHKKGYKLDPAKINQVMVFTSKAKKELKFRIESLKVGGPAGETPPVDPKDVRIQPQDTYLLGGGVKLELDKQVKADDKVDVSATGSTFSVNLPADGDKHNVNITPPIGRWDLRYATEVRVKVTNTGNTPITPGIKVSSDRWHATDLVEADSPIAPGRTHEIVVPFKAATSWQGPDSDVTKAHQQGMKGTGATIATDKVDAVRMAVKHNGKASLKVDSIRAMVTPIKRPDWLGKRPPVEGDWEMTFNDDFDGSEIDMTKWHIYGPNWWGGKSKTHWSKDNLVLGDGKVRMRMSVDPGWHNDDPNSGHQSELAGGLLETYGKWVQRYGYFECRAKLPEAPGLWPAFWLMPDRGPEAGPQWKRQDTGKGGMEFDIMEHLTRWGPYRYNIAMHWDGYGKGHKSVGSTNIYVHPDEDGYITTGLLWLPGKAVFYCNGEEVARWENPRISDVRSCILLTMPIGGWDNNAIDNDQLPADWTIDYVRVWQREDLASEVDGVIGGPDAKRSDQN